MIRLTRILLIVIIAASASCSKAEMYDDGVAGKWHDDIVAYQRQGVTVDKVKNDGGALTFSFSNGGKKGFSHKKVPAVTIDVRGFWRVGNKLTDKELASWSSDEMILDNAAGGEFIGIIESYTDWSFFFNDNSSVTLKKTLYSYDADSRKKGINHRGYNGSVPENTLPAFRMSRLKGFRYVETDVRFSSDGIPVLLHDENVTRTSNGRGAVADLSWNELRALDFGSNFRDYKNTKIPSLDEFLALCREIGLAPYLELKVGTEEQIGGIVRAVEEYGLADRTVYISFFDYLLRYVLTFNPSATVGLLVESPDYENAVSPALSLRTGANTVFIDSHDYGEGTVRLCRDAGLPLEIWTIDASSVIRSLSDYVSGVTSNNLHAGRVLSGKE